MPYFSSLEIPHPTHLVGNKAVQLTRLINTHLPVPSGYVIHTSAYPNHLTETVEQLMNLLTSKNTYAVRSSSTVEDTSHHSWAGQFSSYLNIQLPDIYSTVFNCFQSMNNSNATQYQLHQHLPSSGQLAVIIQQLILAETAGVAFSQHPVTNDQSQIIIEASLGLGQSVVDGSVTPDYYQINKHSNTLEAVEVGSKQIAVEPLSNQSGTIQQTVDPAAAQRQCLSDQQLQIISNFVKTIELTLGYPVDVEWAWANNQCYILQARAITTQ